MSKWDPKGYDAWYETPLGRHSDELEKRLVMSMAGVKTGEMALDAGSGTGNYTVELSRLGATAVGVDSSPEMLGYAREKTGADGPPVFFLAADAARLPFGDSVFDLVLSVGMFCFVKDAQAALKEMRRVLKPGGRLVVGTLNSLSPWAFLRRVKGLFSDSVYREAEFISPRAIEDKLSKADFEVRSVKTCIHYPPVDSGPFLALARPIERLGSRLLPGSGAFICALAVKR